MMIENDKIVIIDFDRYDFGDPGKNLIALYGVLNLHIYLHQVL